jgi:hypothetical protein
MNKKKICKNVYSKYIKKSLYKFILKEFACRPIIKEEEDIKVLGFNKKIIVKIIDKNT